MAESGAGASAEVGVKKMDENDNVVQKEGYVKGRNWARVTAYLVFILAGFGVWKFAELVLALL